MALFYPHSCCIFPSLDQRPLLLGRWQRHVSLGICGTVDLSEKTLVQNIRCGSKCQHQYPKGSPQWTLFPESVSMEDPRNAWCTENPKRMNVLWYSTPIGLETPISWKVLTSQRPTFQLEDVTSALATADIWKSARRFSKGNLSCWHGMVSSV